MEGLENPSNDECARCGTYSIRDLGQRNSNTKPDMLSPGPMQRHHGTRHCRFWDTAPSSRPSALAAVAGPQMHLPVEWPGLAFLQDVARPPWEWLAPQWLINLLCIPPLPCRADCEKSRSEKSWLLKIVLHKQNSQGSI